MSRTQRFVEPGDVVRIEISFSEVCMSMHVAGEVMNVRFQCPHGYPNAQLLLDDGREFSAPITPGEAGFYCDSDGKYYCYPFEGGLKQFTITYRSKFGASFAFIESDSEAGAKRQITTAHPGATVLSIRENNPPLPTIAGEDGGRQ